MSNCFGALSSKMFNKWKEGLQFPFLFRGCLKKTWSCMQIQTVEKVKKFLKVAQNSYNNM
jgi:hypothetical protein